MDLLVLFHEYVLGEGPELEYYYHASGKRSTEIIVLLWYSFLDAYKNEVRQISVRNGIDMNLPWLGKGLSKFLRLLSTFSFWVLYVKFCKVFNLRLRNA